MSLFGLLLTLSLAHGVDFVRTPGGYLPRSSVHQVQSGAAVLETAPPVMQPMNTIHENGWVSWAITPIAKNDTVLGFWTSWIVPPLPAKRGDQIVYLFNGLEDVTGSVILQPVLSWTKEDQWSISSWYVTAQHSAFQTAPIHVQPGQKLVGWLRGSRSSSGPGLFNYSVEFYGMPGTALYARNVPEMRYLVETLEAYSVEDCSNYPEGHVRFFDIGVTTLAGRPSINWTIENRLTNCGQHTYLSPAVAGEVNIGFSH